MKTLALALGLALALTPTAQAQSRDDGGMEMFTRFLRLMIPEHADLLKNLGSPDEYEMPEVLPNGDIIIRRKAPAMPPPREGEVDL